MMIPINGAASGKVLMAKPSLDGQDPQETVMSDRLNTSSNCAREAFALRFGCDADLTIHAPGRVNLIGDHTDYNDGFAMPIPIARYVVIAAALDQGAKQSVVYSGDLAEQATLNIDDPFEHDPGWARYAAGVLHLARERLGEFPSFNAHIESSIPTGAGLSSSAAVAVALVNLVEALTQRTLEPIEKARLCQQAEHVYAGVPCGIMDQVSIATARPGCAIMLDCRSIDFDYVALEPADVSIMILDSGVSRTLATSVYGVRRRTCEAAVNALGISSLRELSHVPNGLTNEQRKRVRHVLSENDRVCMFAKAVKQRDWLAAGQLMYKSHESLRDDYEVSCPELDAMVETVRSVGISGGVFGCRMTGGGMGGCAVALVETTKRDSLRTRFEFGFQNTGFGSVLASAF